MATSSRIEIKRFEDLIGAKAKALRDQIVTETFQRPNVDYVYYFPGSAVDSKSNVSLLQTIPVDINTVFAGSAALHKIQSILIDQPASEWKPSDVDQFVLNQPKNNRYCMGIVDVVQCTEKTVEELLSRFDLPMCRAAMNSRYDIWISLQCLGAIFSGKYHLPSYMSNVQLLTDQLVKHRPNYKTRDSAMYIFTLLTNRIAKYKTRGFDVVWCDTWVEPNQWIKVSFHYREDEEAKLSAPAVATVKDMDDAVNIGLKSAATCFATNERVILSLNEEAIQNFSAAAQAHMAKFDLEVRQFSDFEPMFLAWAARKVLFGTKPVKVEVKPSLLAELTRAEISVLVAEVVGSTRASGEAAQIVAQKLLPSILGKLRTKYDLSAQSWAVAVVNTLVAFELIMQLHRHN